MTKIEIIKPPGGSPSVKLTGEDGTSLTLKAGGGGGGGSMTGEEILAALAPVDGAGSGLDADTVDGQQASAFAAAAHEHAVGDVTPVQQDRILGRVSAGSGDAEELTATQVRTVINVEDGAAAPPYGTSDLVDGAVTAAKFQDIATDRIVGRDSAGTGDVEQLTVGGGLEFTGSGGIQRSAISGDVAIGAGSGTSTIGSNAVGNTKLADMGGGTVKGRASGTGVGDPQDLTGAQVAAIVGEFGQDTPGLVPGPTNDDVVANRVLRADGAWADQTGGGGGAPTDAPYLVSAANGTLSAERVLGGESGVLELDYSVAGVATAKVAAGGIGTAKLADGAVTLAKMDALATDRLIGRDTAGAGAPEAISVGGGLEFDGAGGIRRQALTGDVTATAGSNATAIAAGVVGTAELEDLGVTTGKLADGAVTNAKAADMAEATIKGRAAGAGAGDPTDLTAAQARTILNVEDGATGDQSAAEILAALLTVDGAGSGLDADLLDGQSSAAFAQASHSHAISDTTGLQAALDAKLANVVEDTTPQLGGQLDVNGQVLGDGTRELLAFVEDAAAVNHLEIENQAAGGGPILRATGDDTNVDLHLDCKGAGAVVADANLTVNGNIAVTGTVDGRDVATDGTKLDGIEAGAAAPPYGTSDLSDEAVTLTKLQHITSDRLLGRDTASAGDVEEIGVSGGVEFDGAGNIRRSALTGDVTASAGSNATTIANDAVSNAKLRDSAGLSLIGRSTNTTGDPADIVAANDGEVFRRSGVAVGFGTIATAGIGDAQVTLAKIANLTQQRILGRAAGAGSGAPQELTPVQLMAALVGSSIHYGCWYGGVVTLASGSETTLALGVEVANSGIFSLSGNEITVSAACVALFAWWSTTLEASVSGEAQVFVQFGQDPATGTFTGLTGTRKDCAVNAGDADLDRATIAGVYIASPLANYKYRLVGQIQSGAATVKTVAAGTTLTLLGISNA